MDIFAKAYDGFDTILNDYVLETAQKIAETIAPVAWTMMGIYIVLWGFAMIRGMIDEPVTDGLFRMLKLSLIVGFALQIGVYGQWIVDTCINTPEVLASKMSLGHAVSAGSVGQTGDALVNKVLDTAKEIWSQAGIMNGNVGHYFIAIVFCSLGLIMAGLGFIFFLMAKVGLVFSLAVGPLFILMLMFKPTQRFFESWVTLVVGFMLQIVFILAAVGFAFYIFQKVADRAAQLTAGQQLLEAPVQLAAATMLGVVLLFVAKSMASSVSNGFNISLGEVSHKMSHAGRVGRAATDLVKAKATGGASLAIKAAGAAKTAGQGFRAMNTVRRG